MDGTQVLVSTLGLCGVIATGVCSVMVARLSTATKAVHKEVRSGNGKPTGEYITTIDRKINSLARLINEQHRTIREEVKGVFDLVVQHSELDHGDSDTPRDGTVQQGQRVRVPCPEETR